MAGLIHGDKKKRLFASVGTYLVACKKLVLCFYKFDEIVHCCLASVLVAFEHSRGLANTTNFLCFKMCNIY